MSFDSTVIRPAIGDLQEINDLEDRLAELEENIPGPVQDALDLKVSSTSIDTIVSLTQAAYDALADPDSRTLYVVVG